VKKGELIEDPDHYYKRFEKKSKQRTIPKGKRRPYTITEVLRIWEALEDDAEAPKKTPKNQKAAKSKKKHTPKRKETRRRIQKNPPLSFFQKLEVQNFIPDRSAASLRTAWKKFSTMTKIQFIRSSLKKSNCRYSHAFSKAPEVEFCELQKPKRARKNLASMLNSASTKPHEEAEMSSENEEMEVDMNVMTKEPSIIDKNSEDMEFILAVEDMQSVVSKGPEGVENTYSLKPRKRARTSLDELYGKENHKVSYKRVKVTETENN